MIGMGGGVVLLAFMTLFIPLQVIIPIHGVVQLGEQCVTRVALAIVYSPQARALVCAIYRWALIPQ